MDLTPNPRTTPTCFTKNEGHPDVLDVALYKNITVTYGSHAIHALASYQSPVEYDFNHHRPYLPKIFTTNWDEYRPRPILSKSTDVRIHLHTSDDIEHAVKTLTTNTQTALRVTTIAATVTTNSASILTP